MSLAGRRILVTRARHQASDFVNQLRSRGAEPQLLPAIEIVPPTDGSSFQDAMTNVQHFDWMVFTSVNVVRAVAAQSPILGECRLAAIGPATAHELTAKLRTPDVLPDTFSNQGLMGALGDVRGKRILVPRGDLARRDVVEYWRDAGAEVTEVEAYRTVAAPWPDGHLPEPDLITFTSSSGVLATHERLAGRGLLDWLIRFPILCIGPVTARTVQDMGASVAAVAEQHTIAGLVLALEEFVANA